MAELAIWKTATPGGGAGGWFISPYRARSDAYLPVLLEVDVSVRVLAVLGREAAGDEVGRHLVDHRRVAAQEDMAGVRGEIHARKLAEGVLLDGDIHAPPQAIPVLGAAGGCRLPAARGDVYERLVARRQFLQLGAEAQVRAVARAVHEDEPSPSPRVAVRLVHRDEGRQPCASGDHDEVTVRRNLVQHKL